MQGAIYFLLVVVALILALCEDPTGLEAKRAQLEARIEEMESLADEERPDPTADIYDEIREERLEIERRFLEVARAYKSGDCETALGLFDRLSEGDPAPFPANDYFGTPMMQSWRLIMAVDGKCLSMSDEDIASAMLSLTGQARFGEIEARLSAFYWQGAGVDRDREKARRFARQAILHRAGTILEQDQPDNPYWGSAQLAELWGLSPRRYYRNFTNAITGPWELPPPLKSELDRLEQVRAEGGKALFELSQQILKKAEISNSDRLFAFELLEFAATNFDFVPAKYAYFRALVDDEKLYKLRCRYCDNAERAKTFREINDRQAYDALRDAASAGSAPAQMELVARFEIAYEAQTADRVKPDYVLIRNYYYWLNRLKANGESISEERLLELEKQLSPMDAFATADAAKRPEWPAPFYTFE